MTNPTSKDNSQNVVDDQFVPEIFAANAAWFGLSDNNRIVYIDFMIPRESGDSIHTANLRLIMTLRGAQGLARGLSDFLKQRNLYPVPKPESTQMQSPR